MQWNVMSVNLKSVLFLTSWRTSGRNYQIDFFHCHWDEGTGLGFSGVEFVDRANLFCIAKKIGSTKIFQFL